jgi:hypothetical protein
LERRKRESLSRIARHTKEKFSEHIGALRNGAVFRVQEKRAGAVAEEATELSGNMLGGENAAVNVGSNDDDGAGVP